MLNILLNLNNTWKVAIHYSFIIVHHEIFKLILKIFIVLIMTMLLLKIVFYSKVMFLYTLII